MAGLSIDAETLIAVHAPHESFYNLYSCCYDVFLYELINLYNIYNILVINN